MIEAGWRAGARRARLRLAVGATLFVAVAPACTKPAAPAPEPRTPTHVIVVTIDTLRADRLGAYGNTAIPTPNFDRIAREGVRAVDATTHVPITRPAHASLFTGRYPAEHDIRENISLPLAADVPTLAETLKAQGFATAAFVSSFVLSTQSGLNRGFDHYDDAFRVGTSDEALLFGAVQRRGDDTVARVEQWLDARSPEVRARRTALWVHLYDPHDPYEPPEPFASEFADRPYDGEVAWTDTLLGRLRASLEARQLWDNALVVVTADHGEALGEHDETGHGYFTYETTLKVPLVMRGPGLAANATVNGTVRLVDLAPTVLSLLGAAPLGETTGVDLSAHLAPGGPAIARMTYAESLTPLLQYQWSDLRVMRDGAWKYILAPRPELYDLAADPGETHDLASTQTETAARLLRVERNRASSKPAAAPSLSADVLQKLGALGYVSPGAPRNTVAQGADPKDKIDEFRTLSGLMREGLTLLRQKRYAESASRFERLKKSGSDTFQVHFYLGRAQLGLGRAKEAEQSFERTIEAMPNFTQAHLSLAEVRLARKDSRGAVEALQRGQRDAPNEPELFDREGQIWQQLGDLPRAMTAYEEAAALAPRDALVRWRMGELLLTQGVPDRALAMFREATALDPSVADFWNSLGMVLGGNGQHAEAADAFRKALEREPNNARYAYNLGLVLMRAGDPAARAQFERALALDPTFRPARDRLGELAR
jgi:arylsulfatase A-like enzyme/Tfp pilus assembly protein PilF